MDVERCHRDGIGRPVSILSGMAQQWYLAPLPQKRRNVCGAQRVDRSPRYEGFAARGEPKA